ncbi:MAG: M1 family metallopeptidase [Bacteroidota bacterium]
MNKLLIIASVLFLTSCHVTKENTKDQDKVVVEETIIDSTATPTIRKNYNASQTVLTDLIHTKLEVNFDWSKSRLNGVATITMKPHFYATDRVILDAKGMDIHSVKMDGKALNYLYDSLELTVQLNKTYTRKENFTLVIDYTAKPNERTTGGSAAITSDKGLYFINPTGEDPNVMPQIWTQGETEANSVWFPTVDSPNMKTTEEIFITVDAKYSTLSNGKLLSQKKNADGTRTDHWKQTLPHAPYLFMMGVGQFKEVKDSYKKPDGSTMEVNYFVEPEWEASAKAIFGETPQMIAHFSKLLGYDYPWDKYHQIVVRDYVSGAMENTGAVIFGDFVYKNERELLDANDNSTIAHELFHHWFGDLVTCESWSNLPLNESFANYSQYLWDEHRYGIDEADYQADQEADGYYQSSQVQGYHNLIWFDYDDKEQMFDGHSYNKGGRILHMLRNYIGDEAFFEGIKNYLTTNQFKPAEYNQLRISFEEVSGQDLNWFFDQWFLASGHPILDFNQSVNGNTLTVSVEQKQNLEESPIFKLPMEIAIFDGAGKTVHKILVDSLKQSFNFKITGTLNSVVFDEQQMLLAKTRENNKPQEQYIHQFYNGERWKARRDGLLSGSKGTGEAAQRLVLDALSDKFWQIRQLAIEKSGKLNGDFKFSAMNVIKKMAAEDPSSAVRASAINFLSNSANDPANEAIFETAIQKDQSYMVITSALQSLVKSNPDKALELAKGLEGEKSSKMLVGIGQIYGAHGKKEQMPFFEKNLSGTIVQGFDQLSMMNSLTYFVSHNDEEIATRSLPLFTKLAASGGHYTKMFLPQNVNYLIGFFTSKIEELNAQIAEFEKSKDALYADQARKKRAVYEGLVTDFTVLAGE